MSTGGGDAEKSAGHGGAPPTCHRLLDRKSSKSRLEKQHGVEDEDPPGGRMGTGTAGHVGLLTVDDPVACSKDHSRAKIKPTPATSLDTALKKMQIPETRVESFDNLETDGDDKGAPTKSKVLVRSHAMCGDDDTRLTTRLNEQGSKGSAGSSLSRDSSNELYTDSTGINLEDFIINTLHKNPRDRTFLIELEQTLIRFVQDGGKQIHRFPAMSSYNRMLVHRVAAFFGLDHNVDQSGQAVVVSKMQATRIPDVPFRDYIKHDVFTDEPKKSLLKRDAQSYEEAQVGTTVQQFDIRKARSFEDREEEYAKVRARIFNQQDSSSSVEGVIESPVRPWSSTDSSSDQSQVSMMQLQRTQLMQKACSFGGVPTLYRTDATKVSPRRSNTESNRDVGSFTRQPTIPEASSGPTSPIFPAGQTVIFAVASIEQVPPGAVIINGQTGQPYLNPDGTLYRHGALPHRPLSASPQAGPPSYSPVPSMLPFCGTPLLSDNIGLSSQMQQLSILQSPGASPAAAESSHSNLATPQVYLGPPQVYTYIVSQNQQQQQSQPIQPQASAEINPQRLPTAVASQMAILPPSQPTGYVQPVSMQYHESVPYAMHAGSIAYTQAPSQSSVAVANSAMGYPLYYPAHPTAAPLAGVRLTSSAASHAGVAVTASTYGTQRFGSPCPNVAVTGVPPSLRVEMAPGSQIESSSTGVEHVMSYCGDGNRSADVSNYPTASKGDSNPISEGGAS